MKNRRNRLLFTVSVFIISAIVTAIVLLAIMSFFVSVSAAENQFDPQTLIGEWWAEWNYKTGVGGKVFLTITSIEGTKVSGEYELTGAKAWGKKFKNGILTENVLRIITDLDITLVFKDNTMTGFSLSGTYGEQRSEIINGVKIK